MLPEGSTTDGHADDVLTLHEERVSVALEPNLAVRLRVRVVTDTIDAPVEVTLEDDRVEIEHVPVGRMLELGEATPAIREEGGVTIVPVLAETVLLERRVVLVEELHLRRVVRSRVETRPVPLRRQRAVVEREPA